VDALCFGSRLARARSGRHSDARTNETSGGSDGIHATAGGPAVPSLRACEGWIFD